MGEFDEVYLEDEEFDFEFPDSYKNEQSEREIYQYEVELPLSIELMLKNNNLEHLEDELLIYSLRVDSILENIFCQTSPLNHLMRFLKMAVDSGSLNLVKIVWNYGLQTYLRNNIWNTRILLDYIVDLIHENKKNQALKYIISNLDVDDKKIYIKSNDNVNSYSCFKRNNICGNFLATAVYYNNIEAIIMLLPKQLRYNNTFRDCLMYDFLNDPKIEQIEQQNFTFGNGPFIGFFNTHGNDTLYSLNPTMYAFDNGNIEALELLIENGYKIDFNSLDFSMNVANYAHKNTLNYLIKNHPQQMLQINIDDILKSSNYSLLRWMLDHGLNLQSININQLFNYSLEFTFNDNQKLLNQKLKNIEKCMIFLGKKGFKTSDILIPLKFGISNERQSFIDLCFSIYKETDTLDITSIFHRVCKSIEMLAYISEKIKLNCDSDNLIEPPLIRIREFQKCLKLVEFKYLDDGSVNMLITQILDLNAVTGIRLLLKHKFVTKRNYAVVVDYIVNNGLDKLLNTLIASSSDMGGVKRVYDI